VTRCAVASTPSAILLTSDAVPHERGTT